MADMPGELRLAVKLFSWDEARAELEGDMRRSLAARLSDVVGGVTGEIRGQLLPGLTVAASILAGASDDELATVIRALQTAEPRRVWDEMQRRQGSEYPGQPQRQPVDDRLLVGLNPNKTADVERAQLIRSAASRGHDMVPPEQGAELICSRCQYDLKVCASIDCDTPGVMRPKVEQMRAAAARD